jgi:hypothetical protein
MGKRKGSPEALTAGTGAAACRRREGNRAPRLRRRRTFNETDRPVQRKPFGLVEFVNALRDALGKLLDLADAAADEITKGRA